MARVTYIDGIDTIRGALDSVKEGQANRARLVCKWHYWGEKWIDEDGSKVHLVYTYHFHEGPWSEGATRNREMIKAAQRMAHVLVGAFAADARKILFGIILGYYLGIA